MSHDKMRPTDPPDIVQQLARASGGTITECAALPDGSGFAVLSMPLPVDHWAVVPTDAYEPPPMRLRMGTDDQIAVQVGAESRSHTYTRREFADVVTEAGRYAYRSATMQGRETDLDPDALIQNLVVAFVGYWTHDGRTDDEWALPESERGQREQS